MHLIGDLHQPLHIGYADDKGGNDYQVAYKGKGTNLHKVWDSEIIEDQNITLEPCLQMANNFREDEKRLLLMRVDLPLWIKMNHEMAAIIYPRTHKIDSDYIRNEVPVIEHQLAVAGVRLAAVLHQVVQAIPMATKSAVDDTTQVKEVALDSLNSHIGETVWVCGKVFGVKYLTTSKNTPTFINVGAAYPNSPLTLLIRQDVRNRFSYKPDQKLTGQSICVTGRLQLYKDKPEIVVKNESEIEIK